MSDWKISRKGTACGACEHRFVEEEEFVSAIFELPPGAAEGSFERLDACPACFEDEERQPFSHWLTKLPRQAEAAPLLDLTMARDFLIRLARENDPARHNLMYILTLLLLRKRRVKLVEQRVDDGVPVMQLIVPAEEGQEEVTVPSVTPTETETAEIEAELGRLFGLTSGTVPDPTSPVSD